MVDVYEITERHVKGEVVEDRRHYDKMTEVMVCLGGPEDKDYDGMLKLLDVLFSNTSTDEKRSVLEEEYNIPMTEQMDKEVNGVGSWGEGIFRSGEESGESKGSRKAVRIIKAYNNGSTAEQISSRNDYPLGYVRDVINDYENA